METQDVTRSSAGALAPDRGETGPGTGFRRMLVCLDRSEAAETVLPLAAHLAQIDRARMTLLNAIETRPDAPEVHATDALEWDIVRQEARAYLDRVAHGLENLGVVVESQVAEGSAAHGVGIAALAADLEADLLVLSTYGEGGTGPWTLGGTAEKILALAQGSLLIVPAGVGHTAPSVPLRRILVPLDGSPRGESVLSTVLRLARADDAEIVVAHAVPDPLRTEVLSTPEDLELAHELANRLAARADVYLERMRSQLVAGGARARVAVCRAVDHREGLLALAAGERADLIVVSAHGSVCNPKRRFGSVTSHLIAQSTVPVLVMQDLPGRSGRDVGAEPSRLPSRSIYRPLGSSS
jgi:nucleotide-binding universal stress UspA family protein